MKGLCKWTGSLILAGILAASLVAANERPVKPVVATRAQVPAANPKDVASPEAVIGAVYDAISGPQGQRDWNRFRSLFVDGARLTELDPGKDGGYVARVMNMDEFIAYVVPMFEKEGFYEREAAHKTESWADIQQVFSTYESRHAASDAKPFVRGINGFQLINDGKRWWVVSVFWQEESASNPIPAKFLRTIK